MNEWKTRLAGSDQFVEMEIDDSQLSNHHRGWLKSTRSVAPRVSSFLTCMGKQYEHVEQERFGAAIRTCGMEIEI